MPGTLFQSAHARVRGTVRRCSDLQVAKRGKASTHAFFQSEALRKKFVSPVSLLLVPQRFDWVESRGATGGEKAEGDADDGGKADRDEDNSRLKDERQFQPAAMAADPPRPITTPTRRPARSSRSLR